MPSDTPGDFRTPPPHWDGCSARQLVPPGLPNPDYVVHTGCMDRRRRAGGARSWKRIAPSAAVAFVALALPGVAAAAPFSLALSLQPPADLPPPSSPPSQPPAATAPSQPAAPAQPPAAQPPAATPPAAQPPAAPAEPPPAAAPAEPPATAPAEPPATAPAEPATPPSAGPDPLAAPVDGPEPAVPDAAWDAMLEKNVVIEKTDATSVTGKLAAVTPDTVVVVADDGSVSTLPKSDATALRLADEAAAEEEPPAEEEAPAEEEEDKPEEEEADYPKLGLFTSHGIAYGHWRIRDASNRVVSDGSATYALDLGVGYNFKETLGIYAMIGGVVAGKLFDDRVKANAGHFNAMLRFKKKYFAFMGGIGVGWTRVREPTQIARNTGVSIPLRLMGNIPLPKKLFLGVGVGYELAIFGDKRLLNAPSLLLAFGRW